MDLTEFLLARIAEDEEAAGKGDRFRPDAPDFGDTFGIGYDVHGDTGRSGRYLTIDPARVLAECEAKRRIVDAYQRWDANQDRSPDYWAAPMGDVLDALASVYADHPDYRPEWRAVD